MRRMSKREEQQAAAWADLTRRGGLSDEQARGLEAWLDGDADRAALLRAHERMLGDPALAAAIRAVQAAPVRARRPAPLAWATATAGVAAAIAVSVWFGGQMIPERQSLTTPAGRPTEMALDDGSQVRLNGGGDLRTEYGRNRRDVFLKGEAYFSVARDPRRPFSVHAAGYRVTALGTRFNVDERTAGGLEVRVVEGRVEVVSQTDPARRTVLEAGGRFVLRDGTERVFRADLAAAETAQPDWIGGWIDADDMTLSDLALELERQTPGLKVRFADPALGRRRISGRFPADRPQEILETVATTQGLAARPGPSGEIHIGR